MEALSPSLLNRVNRVSSAVFIILSELRRQTIAPLFVFDVSLCTCCICSPFSCSSASYTVKAKCWLIISSLVVEPAPSNMSTSMGKNCLSLSARWGGASWLMVTPRVSGLERSQEKSLELHLPEPNSSTSSASRPPSFSPVTAPGTVSRPNLINGNSSRHNGSPPLSKHKPFLPLPGRPQSIYNLNNRYAISDLLLRILLT